MGAQKVGDVLPSILRKVTDAGHPIVWECDPMHGNTYETDSGIKTRDFDVIMDEVRQYFDVHKAEETWPGGVHCELTGDAVTECVGGGDALAAEHLGDRYETMCDPRLNGRQSLDLAFHVAELLSDFR